MKLSLNKINISFTLRLRLHLFLELKQALHHLFVKKSTIKLTDTQRTPQDILFSIIHTLDSPTHVHYKFNSNILINFFFSHPLPNKPPIKTDQQNISTPKTGIQDPVVTHYDCSPKHITNMQYYKLNRIGECKIKPADFQILPAQVLIFSQIRTIQVRAYAIYAKLSDKEVFCHKISLKRGYWLDRDNW